MTPEHVTNKERIDEPMTQLDYVDRTLEGRETGSESVAALLAGLGCGLGVLALWFAPMVIGFVAIGCAILALCLAGERNRFARVALTIAAFGWLIGSILAIITGNSPISINLT